MSETTQHKRPWLLPMTARSGAEQHRAATPLELLFDLCFVVAVAQAAAQLHHAVAENHAGSGAFFYLLVFFAIWWAWMNFTWFASAYDTDDGPYRLITAVQIAGGLILAAGISQGFHGDFTVMTIGYVVMRLAMVTQWLRAAKSDPARRACTLRYAAGISLVQLGWVLRLLLPGTLGLIGFLVLAVAELAVPVIAERRVPTTWHPGHIAERYGLFTLIVLGESVLAATTAIQSGVATGHLMDLIGLSVAGLVLVFSMWWLYFDQNAERRLTSLRAAMIWGYGHLVIFGSAAAMGAGLAVTVDHVTHQAHITDLAAGAAITVPVALFLLSVWLLHVGPTSERKPLAIGCPVVAVAVLGATFTPFPVLLTAALAAILVLLNVLSHRRPV